LFSAHENNILRGSTDIAPQYPSLVVTQYIIILLIDISLLGYVCTSCTLADGIIQILIVGLVNMLMFGVLTFLIALIKGRSK